MAQSMVLQMRLGFESLLAHSAFKKPQCNVNILMPLQLMLQHKFLVALVAGKSPCITVLRLLVEHHNGGIIESLLANIAEIFRRCPVATHRFHYNGALKHHYKWHSGYRPFKCPICEKSFLQRGILKEHIRIHTGERPYSCSHCDMSFKTGSQCRMHTQRHTSDFPWGCDICGKNFLKLESYKIHMRRHRNEKIFVCDVCQKGFAEQYALKKHLRTHTGERPFKCATCGKSFGDRSNMIKHMRLHSETTTKVSVEATTETSTEINQQNTVSNNLTSSTFLTICGIFNYRSIVFGVRDVRFINNSLSHVSLLEFLSLYHALEASWDPNSTLPASLFERFFYFSELLSFFSLLG
uniref:C2H2-type domain-containing protein n=1 Tax=Phlebotomus papatasi TaxID=29031 RepID=A0A1B0FY56_PHLPP